MAMTEPTTDPRAETTSDASQPAPNPKRPNDFSRGLALTALGVVLGALALLVMAAALFFAPLIVGNRVQISPEADPANAVDTVEAPASAPVTEAPTSVPASEAPVAVPVESCSAAGMDVPPAQPGLSASVAATRSAIIAAATTCDYEALAGLMSVDFVASTDPGADVEQWRENAIALWREQEANNSDPMAKLVGVLSLPHGSITTDDGPESAEGEVTSAVWPTAALYDPFDTAPVADRDALLAVYSSDEIESFSEAGYYLGHRLGINESGSWRWFIAGD